MNPSEKQTLSKRVSEIEQTAIEAHVLEEARKQGYKYINLTKLAIPFDALTYIPETESRINHIVCFKKSPTAVSLGIDLAFWEQSKPYIDSIAKQGTLELYAISKESLSWAQDQYKRLHFEDITKRGSEDIKHFETLSWDELFSHIKDKEADLNQYHPEELLLTLFGLALYTHATDIHFVPGEDKTDITFRIDGIIEPIIKINNKSYSDLLVTIKYKAALIANATSIPQDGRFTEILEGHRLMVRTATIPSHYHEACTLRIIPQEEKTNTISSLGFRDTNLHNIMSALRLGTGLMLVCGPTGSGKTTTLYALLKELNTGERSILTLEDPVEYIIPGIVQSQVDERNGYTFDQGLRSMVRHDPDVLLIGEIRDIETAKTSLQAALTGHIVLSSLHAHSCLDAIPRLRNMGVPLFMIGPSLSCIIAQRLVRKLCLVCNKKRNTTPEEQAIFAKYIKELELIFGKDTYQSPQELAIPVGCKECHNSGYNGLTTIAEVLRITPEIESMISETGDIQELPVHLKKDKNVYVPLEIDGILKVLSGITTLSELTRVIDVSSE